MFPVSDVIPSRTTPVVTISLIAFNAIAFVIELFAGADRPRLIGTFGLIPAFFSWAAVVTSMFLHAGWLHFLGNMLFLWIFGDNVEDRLGHGRYALFYMFCGTTAALGHVVFNPYSTVPTIGASGAVSGVMGAYFVFYPHSRVLTAVFLIVIVDLVEVPAVFFLGVWFLMQLISGVGTIGVRAEGGVAFWAHVIGFAFGALAAIGWRAKERLQRGYR